MFNSLLFIKKAWRLCNAVVQKVRKSMYRKAWMIYISPRKVLSTPVTDQHRGMFNITIQQSKGQLNPWPQNPITLKCDLDLESA